MSRKLRLSFRIWDFVRGSGSHSGGSALVILPTRLRGRVIRRRCHRHRAGVNAQSAVSTRTRIQSPSHTRRGRAPIRPSLSAPSARARPTSIRWSVDLSRKHRDLRLRGRPDRVRTASLFDGPRVRVSRGRPVADPQAAGRQGEDRSARCGGARVVAALGRSHRRVRSEHRR